MAQLQLPNKQIFIKVKHVESLFNIVIIKFFFILLQKRGVMVRFGG